MGLSDKSVANWHHMWIGLLTITIPRRAAKMTRQMLTAALHKEDDLYVAECLEVGTVSQGATIEEAVANLKEATELYLEEFPLPEISPRLLTTLEVVAHA
jgi:predicted RNase H-like HicB family nuclease